MTIEVLDPTEWPRLAPIFHEHAGQLPDPAMARILVARDGEQLAGFLVIQLQPHLEPIYVAPAYQGQGHAIALAQAAIEMFPPGVPYWAFAPRPAIERLCERAGLKELPWKVYSAQQSPPTEDFHRGGATTPFPSLPGV